jgi:hypothetical protein
MKGLIRKRSSPAARLQRAITKTQRPGTGESPGDSTNAQPPGNRDQGLPLSGQDKRQFLMEAPVQFSTVSGHWALSWAVQSTVHLPGGDRPAAYLALFATDRKVVMFWLSVTQFYVFGIVVRALEL